MLVQIRPFVKKNQLLDYHTLSFKAALYYPLLFLFLLIKSFTTSFELAYTYF